MSRNASYWAPLATHRKSVYGSPYLQTCVKLRLRLVRAWSIQILIFFFSRTFLRTFMKSAPSVIQYIPVSSQTRPVIKSTKHVYFCKSQSEINYEQIQKGKFRLSSHWYWPNILVQMEACTGPSFVFFSSGPGELEKNAGFDGITTSNNWHFAHLWWAPTFTVFFGVHCLITRESKELDRLPPPKKVVWARR